eukprot:CAMPEP_0172930184 /NCGR_PEP_ID=MMETSP1075-20121228/218861_1 /TAXON_ID=2916 /ORGANISM="Ceratium fusus, Strain PA161109" /LENGTH=256 /DNA_ID=CAMNT_0013791493 /DNA_START=99 /DNA_END=870 /DNA_ORIENTATION=-
MDDRTAKLLLRGERLQEKGQLDQAQFYFEEVLLSTAKLLLRGERLQEKGQLDQARFYFEEVLLKIPACTEAEMNLDMIKRALGQRDLRNAPEAVDEEVLLKIPACTEAEMNLDMIKRALGQRDPRNAPEAVDGVTLTQPFSAMRAGQRPSSYRPSSDRPLNDSGAFSAFRAEQVLLPFSDRPQVAAADHRPQAAGAGRRPQEDVEDHGFHNGRAIWDYSDAYPGFDDGLSGYGGDMTGHSSNGPGRKRDECFGRAG